MTISIHAPREGSDFSQSMLDLISSISIHAPREGSDQPGITASGHSSDFYPRSPRGERPVGYFLFVPRVVRFLSTLPARGATWPPSTTQSSSALFLSTLPARGATHLLLYGVKIPDLFLSTLPARGATTTGPCTPPPCPGNFYPRSPRGERHGAAAAVQQDRQFLSTLPARGATAAAGRKYPAAGFLSTLPARGATILQIADVLGRGKFLSTLPARGATAVCRC